MSRVLAIHRDGSRNWGSQIAARKKHSRSGGNVKIGSATGIFILAGAVLLAGSVYLYQVNGLATKGYEIRELETKIQNLEKEGQNLQIKEVELRSMYNIEKATKDLNLVNSSNVSYAEIKGPVAMK